MGNVWVRLCELDACRIFHAYPCGHGSNVTISISVKPESTTSWYQTTWFKALVVVALAFAALLLVALIVGGGMWAYAAKQQRLARARYNTLEDPAYPAVEDEQERRS